MIEGYDISLRIDRIENDKGYYQSNCRWVTNIKNQNNKRTTVRITHNNQTYSIAEWAAILGVKDNTIGNRLIKGWGTDSVLYGRGYESTL